MTEGVFPLVELAIQVCIARGVREFVVAPGSRSAPLTIALAHHPEITLRVVYDERAAGYVALGMAQQLRRPVGLVCTSGTAAVNFGPAVVEAFYQQIPLLVLTADRPPEWIDQQDNQAIHQTGLYAPHVRYAGVLPSDDYADTRWHSVRLMTEALDAAQGLQPGPVHINIPLREPLYPPPAYQHDFQRARQIPQTIASLPALSERAWLPLLAQWRSARRKLIVVGMMAPDAALHAALQRLQADPSVAVFADITANCWPHVAPLVHADVALGTRDNTTLAALAPDLMIYIGGQVTSKYLKSLLRARPPQALWRVQPAGSAPDTYQATTALVHMAPADFLTALAARTELLSDCDYTQSWRALDVLARQQLFHLLLDAPFGEFRALQQVLAALPDRSHLQIGNSMPIRYANFVGVSRDHVPAQINANRGVSGIDGCVSTAVGAALATSTLTTLVVGDLAFFYDRNGLWQRNLPPNLRIVLLNNHGGGIFDIIEGPHSLDAETRTTYFLTPQPLLARRTALDHGLRYSHAVNEEEVESGLATLFAHSGSPALLEIETSMEVNRSVFQAFRAMVAGLQL
ncbi:2-succinyl-5-enolpyruvyl-6-hydroxy-3-cyclohexene-1-carboxylic-acid synthase [Caldilinea sp.]|uniref:2-succinyl-5-enolpyruvyl-6-hydroxy-3- cyclohexene-1-carboxylic-acid synthase n=1 Tax=Caldilinea sp. TaxID=2293560 RepID=UPI002BC5D113|nr:2-succinyl-5-enolpyruvyl-6-hydroxy-3-cyclohexene-1-carboxylic-acid synthase [Caldilinea sp.]HRA65633.1 2-succinyl-5-enolpyruvyl-6-hydroxy-3-cyclohexene-1-carboxylic-acid synthase [Caldilinea sp.]